jgi:polysaccharide export outer membrane protein
MFLAEPATDCLGNMKMLASRVLTFIVAALVAVGSFAQVPASPIPAPLSSQPVAIASDAPVGGRDILSIRVFQDPNFNTTATVTEEGTITMNPLGKVPVAGLTLPQIEQRIKSLLEARFLNKADVTVDLIEAGSKPISVIGAVSRPGRIGVTGNITLMQAITAAGGLAPGYGRSLYVLRSAPNGLTEQIAVDIDDLMVNGNAEVNLPLRANDVINIPVESMINIYVLGEVMRPGKVQFRGSQRPTLLQALAEAGGPTDRASRTVLLKRANDTKPFNYSRIVDGRVADIALQDGDTIYIKASFF